MSELEDLEVDRDLEDSELEVNRELEDTVAIYASPERKVSGLRWAIGAVSVFLIVLTAWFFMRSEAPVAETEPQPVPEPRVETAPDPLGAAVEEPLDPLEIPGLDGSDEVVRQLVSRLSENPDLAQWLVSERLVRRFVVTIDNIGEGVHPRKHLPVRGIEGDFAVDSVNGSHYIDPTSYDRYNGFVALFVSIDPEGSAQLYSRLRGLFGEAYRDLGYPNGDFDHAMHRAFSRMLEVPIPESPPALVQGVRNWEYADRRIERLSGAQKQLLRLGPANQRSVQEQMRRLAAALGMTDLP